MQRLKFTVTNQSSSENRTIKQITTKINFLDETSKLEVHSVDAENTATVYSNITEDEILNTVNTEVNVIYQSIEKYTVIFKNWDGSIISEKNDYLEGDALIVPENPTREDDEKYTYTFDSWDKELEMTVTSNKEYTAVFTATPIENPKKNYLEINDYCNQVGNDITTNQSLVILPDGLTMLNQDTPIVEGESNDNINYMVCDFTCDLSGFGDEYKDSDTSVRLGFSSTQDTLDGVYGNVYTVEFRVEDMRMMLEEIRMKIMDGEMEDIPFVTIYDSYGKTLSEVMITDDLNNISDLEIAKAVVPNDGTTVNDHDFEYYGFYKDRLAEGPVYIKFAVPLNIQTSWIESVGPALPIKNFLGVSLEK